MQSDLLMLIAIAIIAIFIGVDYLRLQRDPEKPKPKAKFSERAQQNPKEFEYILCILSQLEAPDAEVLKRYINVNDQPPRTDIELLELIDQHRRWQWIADGRSGAGNPHVDEVIYLETLYVAVQTITGQVAST